MIKKQLRSLRMLYATKEMIEKAKNDDGTMPKRNDSWYKPDKCERNYAMYLRCQKLDSIVKVAVFLREEMAKGKKEPAAEIFLNPAGEEYITRYWFGTEEKWSTAMIDNLPIKDNWYSYRYYSVRGSWINEYGKSTIKSALNVENGDYRGIKAFQRRIKDINTKKKEEQQVKPWDEDQKLVPELPKSFRPWMEKEAPPEHFLFFKGTGAKEALCSHCGKKVMIKKPKHNKEGACPSCRVKATMKNTLIFKYLDTRHSEAQIIQTIKDGFVVRIFEGKRYYEENFENPKNTYSEIQRVFIQRGKVKIYIWTMYKQKYYRWVPEEENYNYYFSIGSTGIVYKKNIAQLEKKELKQSGVPKLIRAGYRVNVVKFIKKEKANPAIEMLAKVDMLKMAVDISECSYDSTLLDQNKTELAKILKIDRARMKRLKAINSGIGGLRWMQWEKNQNTEYPNEMIQYFGENDIMPRDLKFISDRMSERKIYHYMQRQQSLSDKTPRELITTWRDALNMASKANRNVRLSMNYAPKNLEDFHNELVIALEEKNIEKQANELAKKWKNVNKNCAALEKYEFGDKEYVISAPKNIGDIIREGIALQHCIHTCDFYFDRINRKESYILFLRRAKSPNVPYYTLEVEPGGNIRQKRTTGDNQNKDFENALKFIKKWQKVITKRLNQEDKQLAKQSEEARKKNYAELRKNGNKIWHGKLQGKLLADVLEEDFMEAM